MSPTYRLIFFPAAAAAAGPPGPPSLGRAHGMTIILIGYKEGSKGGCGVGNLPRLKHTHREEANVNRGNTITKCLWNNCFVVSGNI